MNLAVHSLAFPVSSLGPGARVALWVAGCSRRCPGCITPELLSNDSGWRMPVSAVLRRLLRIDADLQGLTLSGGDPADQAEAISALLQGLRRERPAWDILVYTGWTLEQLQCATDAHRTLLELTDVLIDGPYVREKAPVHPLAGSGNQRVLALSGRGEAIVAGMLAAAPAFNLAVSREGEARLIGVSTTARRAEAHQNLGLQSLHHGTLR